MKFVRLFRPQQTSPAGSAGSGGTQRPPYPNQPASNAVINQSTHSHHYPISTHPAQSSIPPHLHPKQLPQQHQQQTVNRPPLPPSVDQNFNAQQLVHQGHMIANANSRASSSSGGNASTVHSQGGGSIVGGAPTGPSPSAAKQEQRLTHEQVRYF